MLKNALLFIVLSCTLNLQAYKIIGNKLVSQQIIKKIIGNEKDPQAINIKLMDTNLFEEVNITSNTIFVKEALIISKINCKGSSLINTDTCSKLTGLRVGQRLTTAIKEQAIGLLTESLASKNIIAIINFETKIINNTAQIEITIEELSKAKITKLTILGLKKLSQSRLKYSIKNARTNILGSSYDLALIPLYKEQITQKALQEGYYDFYIKSFNLAKIGPNHIILYFEADEGKQYKIGKITHKSTQLDDKITQSALKKLKSGHTLNLKKIEDIKNKISKDFSLLNKAAQIEINYNKQKNQVIDVHFEIKPKAPLLVRNIKIVGNNLSEQNMLLKVTRLIPGQQLYAHSVANAKDNLLQTGFIKKADIYPTFEDEQIADIQIKVQEVSKLELSPMVRFGYGTKPYEHDDKNKVGFLYSIGLRYGTPNLLGKGYIVSTDVNFANKHFDAGIVFGQSSLINAHKISWSSFIRAGLGPYSNTYTHKNVNASSTPSTISTDAQEKSVTEQVIDQYQANDTLSTPEADKEKTDNKTVTIKWKQKYATFGASGSVNLFGPIYGGTTIKMLASKSTFTDNAYLPRIFDDKFYQKNTLLPTLEFPLRYLGKKYTTDDRLVGFNTSITPSINTKNYGITFNSGFAATLPFDDRAALYAQIAGGIMRQFDKSTLFWQHIYKGPPLLEGFSRCGPTELTSMIPIGGQEFLAAQIKCVIPLPAIGDKVRLFSFISAGTIGCSGIDSKPVPQATRERFGLKEDAIDIVNNEHYLRISAGIGLTILATEHMIITVGYSHPIRYQDTYDSPEYFYLSMSTNLDDI